MINEIIILLGIMGIVMLAIVNVSTTKQNKILLEVLAETRVQNVMFKNRLMKPMRRGEESKTLGEQYRRQFEREKLIRTLREAGFEDCIVMGDDAHYWYRGESPWESDKTYRIIGEDISFSADGGNRWTSICL